ncbi:sodium-dependent transporter [Candidatus Micrarchaeota archaeon]|nr:sodium-dependent transporter [Candidatus Micrarchaeota archaeon]
MREHWSSRITFILAAIGSAVGVGNIWRFPYLVGENGGGNFVFPYIVLILIFGLSALLLEFIAGSSIKKTALAAFKSLNKKYYYFTFIPLIINFIIFSYYIVVTGWTLFYLLNGLFQLTPNFTDFLASNEPFFYTVAVAILLYLTLHLKVREGLEIVNKYLTPLLFVCILILLVNSIYIFNFDKALSFYLNFNLSQAISPTNLIAVISQIIFSIGVGYGIMFTYASYSENKNIFSSTLAVVLADTLIALLAGLVVFSIVFSTNIDPASGPTLVFVTLPSAFSHFAFGNMLMPIFFFLLFSAAFTSALSMNELLITNMEDQFKFDRKRAAVYSILLILLLSIPSAFSYTKHGLDINGFKFLEFLNDVIVQKFSPLAVLITILYLGWFYKDLEKQSKKQIPFNLTPIFLFLVRYVIPVILGGLFILQFV